MLNGIAYLICQNAGIPYPKTPPFQRNQNQSAVGGSDITNPFKWAIEVKRCETIEIDKWWKQVTDAAKPGETPFLIYRKNALPGKVHGPKAWNIILVGSVPLNQIDRNNTYTSMPTRVQLREQEFRTYAKLWMERAYTSGEWVPH